MFGLSKMFYCFRKKFVHQGCIYLIQNTTKTRYFEILLLSPTGNVFLWILNVTSVSKYFQGNVQ